jgi:hypothetical protein
MKSGARYASGKLRQNPHGPDRGPPERTERNRLDCRALDLSADWPLNVLVGRDLLDPDRSAALVMRDAAHLYGDHCRVLWGTPFGRSAALERHDMTHDSGDGDNTEVRIRKAYEREREVLERWGVLDAVEAYGYRLVRDWFIRDVIAGVPFVARHERRLAALRNALSELAAFLPRRDSRAA